MKKRFLIATVTIVLFVLILTLSVSAKDVYLEEIPDSLKVQNDTFTHFVVFEEEKYFSGSAGSVTGLNDTKMLEDMTSAGIDASKIGSTYLTKLLIPDTFGGSTVTYVGFNGSFKGNKYFKNVVGFIRMPGTVKSTTDMHEASYKLRYFDFGENSQLTDIPYCFMQRSVQLMLIENFPRNLNSIGSAAFNCCYGAFRGELYLNATTIGETAFNNSISNVTKLTLGPNTKTVGNQSLCVVLGEFSSYFAPADGKLAITELVFECDVSKVTFATQGTNKGAFFFPVSSGRTPYSKLEKIVLSHPDNERAYFDGATFNDFTADGITILFNDSDGADDYVTVYHNFDTTVGVSYESFLADGIKSVECSKCGVITTKNADPVFEFLGYSYKIDTTRGGGLACGYTVNKDALDEYKMFCDANLSFGIIMFNPNSDAAQAATAIFENGKLTITEKALQVEITDVKYSTINMSINGFNDENVDMELVIAFYVKEKIDETSKITIEQGTTAQNGSSVVKGYYNKADVNLATISYNSVTQ